MELEESRSPGMRFGGQEACVQRRPSLRGQEQGRHHRVENVPWTASDGLEFAEGA